MNKTQILSIDDPKSIPTAIEIIAQHGTIAFPTDTIYGLAGDAFDPISIQKIYQIKERPEEKALPVLIGEFSQLYRLVPEISPYVRQIAEAFWPGALTLVLPKSPSLPSNLSAYDTIGVRMPDLDYTRKLIQQSGPLATTSANISGGSNPTRAQDVLDQLAGRVDLILDGGPTPGPIASTVVDATTTELKILREGPITLEDLHRVIRKAQG